MEFVSEFLRDFKALVELFARLFNWELDSRPLNKGINKELDGLVFEVSGCCKEGSWDDEGNGDDDTGGCDKKEEDCDGDRVFVDAKDVGGNISKD